MLGCRSDDVAVAPVAVVPVQRRGTQGDGGSHGQHDEAGDGGLQPHLGRNAGPDFPGDQVTGELGDRDIRDGQVTASCSFKQFARLGG